MEKIKIFLNKYLLHIVTVLFLVIAMNNCSQSKTNKKYVKEINDLTIELNALKKEIPNQKYLELSQKKQMYEFLKLSLYDNNAIVRTVIRPDDRIREYDDEIKKIDEQLNSIK